MIGTPACCSTREYHAAYADDDYAAMRDLIDFEMPPSAPAYHCFTIAYGFFTISLASAVYRQTLFPCRQR